MYTGKANSFSEDLQKVFEPFPSELPAEEENKTIELLKALFQMDFLHQKIN